MPFRLHFRKPLFYVPGLLSLVLLPTLCIWFLYEHHSLSRWYVKKLDAWDPKGYERSEGNLPETSHPERRYIDISFSGNDIEDIAKLDHVRKEIRKLVASNDTGTGVHINFAKDARYRALVEALDILEEEGAHLSSFYKRDIWIFNPIHSKVDDVKLELIPPPCGGARYYTEGFEGFTSDKKEAEYQAKIKFIKESTALYYPSGVLFLVLCFMAIWKVRKR